MQKNTFILLSIVVVLVASCGSIKDAGSEKLYGAVWELDYISGPRIAFEGLFPDKKPQISFNRETNQISGNAGCNGYSADYTLNGNQISFGEPGPATLMFCGGGEKQFLNMMRKVDGYNFDAEGELNLLVGKVPMLRFKKID